MKPAKRFGMMRAPDRPTGQLANWRIGQMKTALFQSLAS
jgi:hypothetical protein